MSSNYYTVNYQNAPHSEVSELIEQLDDLTSGKKRSVQMSALLALAIYRQHPEVNSETLMNAVQQTSEFICTLLVGETAGETEQ